MCEFQDLTGSTISWPKPGDVAFTPASRGLGAEVSQDRHGRLVMMMTGYKEAADHLVQKTVDEPYQRNSLVYPILFNYRQFVELNLKLQNSVQNFPDSRGKQRPIVSTLDHAIIRRLRWRIWGVAHGYDCRDPASAFDQQGEHQLDRA